MSDILLINTRSWPGRPPSYLPYGVLWIAGLLRKNKFSVSVLDRNVDTQDPKDIFLKEKPKVVGISCLTGPVINDAIFLSRLARSILDKVSIVWGGIHPTIFPLDVLRQDYVDYVVKGEGEFPLLELSRYILLGQGALKTIANLGYKIDKQLILNNNRDFIDLNTLPDPAWDLLNLSNYIQQKFYSSAVVTLNTSRGCPWRCAFCYNQAVNFRRWRGISAQKIVEHMEYFERWHGIRGFQFYDDEFDVNEKRVIDMCELLIQRKKNYRFGHFSRVNHITKERLLIEKQAGLKFIEFGIESGSARMLEFIEKDQTLQDARNAFRICRQAKVKSGALFMLGLPDERQEEVMQTKNFVDCLKAHQTIATIFKPYPATKLFDYCVEKNLFRLPAELEEQGEIYGLGDFAINVSRVPTRILKRIYFHFSLNSIVREMANCVVTGNLGLIAYYAKRRLIDKLKDLIKNLLLLRK
jgi:radical SAM superfamily enzyme YgiQ (UPF0313 family)